MVTSAGGSTAACGSTCIAAVPSVRTDRLLISKYKYHRWSDMSYQRHFQNLNSSPPFAHHLSYSTSLPSALCIRSWPPSGDRRLRKLILLSFLSAPPARPRVKSQHVLSSTLVPVWMPDTYRPIGRAPEIRWNQRRSFAKTPCSSLMTLRHRDQRATSPVTTAMPIACFAHKEIPPVGHACVRIRHFDRHATHAV